MEMSVLGQALDSEDLPVTSRYCKSRATADSLPFEKHSTGPALTAIATVLGTDKIQFVAQDRQQGCVGAH
jgi:hypothetical protein